MLELRTVRPLEVDEVVIKSILRKENNLAKEFAGVV